MKKQIILGSSSPRRHELLKLLVQDFTVETSDIDEKINSEDNPGVAVMSLAFQKAQDIKGRFSDKTGIVIAADTMVYDNAFLGKPQNKPDAKAMLKRLSGQWHDVYTGVAIIEIGTNNKKIFYEQTHVKIADLSDGDIDFYVGTGEPLDKAGAYGIQGIGARYIERIVGDYYTVMGLPVYKLHQILNAYFNAYL